ncbi:GNAT family acetyltransferase [Legionella beliardensis]|uniref:GNAT family acetyltransferase n=1 Tax=Legionella beliardensis TaxID=91822 RepID=A0A378I0A0_9GAMM|nr:GNAT family N-acetyltransferase [Legionella beliardensis]STX28589.1 GNAT family acetyltransferase [Legionella beliardensis]
MIKISLLKDKQIAIPELVQLWHDGLGKIWLPDTPLTLVEQRFQNHLNDNLLPLTLVAWHHDTPVGMCSLRENDGIRPDLMPWLGSLVVHTAYQNQGIGRELIEATKQKAKELGFKVLHLFAFDKTIPEFYETLGWHKIGTDEYKQHPVTVMKVELI